MATSWNSTTPNIKGEIQKLVDDGVFETGGSMVDYLLPWANRIVVEICNNIDIRAMLKSASSTLTTANHVWTLPTDFHKISSRLTKARVADTYVDITGIETLNQLDGNHSSTTTAATPDYIAIEGGNLYVYPKWAGDIVIENYYRLPTDMAASGDYPDIPEDTLRTDLIVAGVAGKYCFPYLNEKELARQYYDASVFPHQGRFFELLEEYRRYIGGHKTIWGNKGSDY